MLDTRTNAIAQSLIGHTGQINTVLKLDDTTVASGAGPNSYNGPSDTTVKLWDIRTSRTTKQKQFKSCARALAALSPSTLAVACGDLTVNIWDTQTDTSTSLGSNFEIDSVVALDANTAAYGSNSDIKILTQI